MKSINNSLSAYYVLVPNNRFPYVLTDFIKVEREVPLNRAVESGLQERRPAISEAVRTSSVILAYSCNSGEHRLEKKRFDEDKVYFTSDLRQQVRKLRRNIQRIFICYSSLRPDDTRKRFMTEINITKPVQCGTQYFVNTAN